MAGVAGVAAADDGSSGTDSGSGSGSAEELVQPEMQQHWHPSFNMKSIYTRMSKGSGNFWHISLTTCNTNTTSLYYNAG